jgi:hypothetical protein
MDVACGQIYINGEAYLSFIHQHMRYGHIKDLLFDKRNKHDFFALAPNIVSVVETPP